MNSTEPPWLNEVLDVLEHRRRTVVATALGVSLLGLLLAWFLPDVVPPNPGVGAAVGIAAVLLSIAAALAVDSVDLTVQGVRHVRAAGADTAAVLAGRPAPHATDTLAQLLPPGGQGPIRIALAPASRGITTVPRWADALAVELSSRDHRVVVLDLASGPDLDGHPGVLEVVRDGLKLGAAVRFDPELLLARLGPGADDEAALAAWPRLADNIPSDVDVLLVSLPAVTQPGVLGALAAADRAWLFASIGRTARVDLIAGLDAADRTGTPTEVVLLDPSREHPAPTEVGVAAPSSEPVEEDAFADDADDADDLYVAEDEFGGDADDLYVAEDEFGDDADDLSLAEDEFADDADSEVVEQEEDDWQQHPTARPVADDGWDAGRRTSEIQPLTSSMADEPEADEEATGGPLDEPHVDVAQPDEPAAEEEAVAQVDEVPAEDEDDDATTTESLAELSALSFRDDDEEEVEHDPDQTQRFDPFAPRDDEQPSRSASPFAPPRDEEVSAPASEDAPPNAVPRDRSPDEDQAATGVDDPTDELPRIVLDRPATESDGWSRRDSEVTGRYAPPLAGPDQDEDPVRVAAALQTLAQEVWARDEEA